jgi:soluble lytic murein transglycosylase
MRKKGVSLALAALLAISSLLSACSPKKPSPTPFVASQDAVPTSAFLSPTLTPVPVETTPPEEPRFKDADLALSFGDYDKALELYRGNPPDSSPASQAAALFGQGLALYYQGNLDEAKAVFTDLVNRFPWEAPGIRASFWLGEMASQAGEIAQAIDAYARYQEGSNHVLDALSFEKRADLQVANENKLLFYQKAYSAAGNDPSLGLVSKLAGQYALAGQYDRALEALRLELESSTLDYSKAYLLVQMGDIEIARGNTETGQAHYQAAINDYPFTSSGYSALVALVDAEVPVDELTRGIINYNVGQDQLAIDAFNRYLSSATQSVDKALYYKALATRRLGTQITPLGSEDRQAANQLGGLSSDKDAIAIWTRQIKEFPNSEFFVDAMEDVVYTLYAYMDQTLPAIQTAEKYIADAPNADYVPRLLNMASQYYQALGQQDKALEALTRIGTQFPASDLAFQSLFFSGITYYRDGRLDNANEAFNRALLLAYVPEDLKEGSLEQAGAYLWLGKTALKKGDDAAGKAYLESAQKADKNGYYGLRAVEVLAGRETFTEPAEVNFEVDLTKERQRATLWLAELRQIPPQTNLDYTKTLFEEPDYLKAIESFKLGLFSDAASFFASLRDKYSKDAENSFRLIKLFYDYGYYDQAILAAQSVVKLTGFANDLLSPNLPPYFAYIEYGAYYLPWVQQTSERYNVPPLVLLSLIRQESLFQANAVSSAGALGLMQLMPSTGAQIALESGWPADFTADDLQTAYVSLVLGSNYLGRQLIAFHGDKLAALAAYNAGPGAVLGWKAAAGDDPDVFVGTIRYLETRTYVRKVAENYEFYSRIYGQP